MIDRITVGAASLMGALTIGVGLVRWAVAPPQAHGRHRASWVSVVLDEAALEALLPSCLEPPYGAVVAQAWRDCPHCARATPGVVHRDGWTCGECLTSSPCLSTTTIKGG